MLMGGLLGYGLGSFFTPHYHGFGGYGGYGGYPGFGGGYVQVSVSFSGVKLHRLDCLSNIV